MVVIIDVIYISHKVLRTGDDIWLFDVKMRLKMLVLMLWDTWHI